MCFYEFDHLNAIPQQENETKKGMVQLNYTIKCICMHCEANALMKY